MRTSKDGTKVPMFVIHKKGLEKDGRTPTLLTGYGGFNIPIVAELHAIDVPACWSTAASWPSRTCAGEASSARIGTRPGCSATSRTFSTMRSPRRASSLRVATPIRRISA